MLPRFLRLFSQDAKDAAETAPSEEPVAEAAAQLAAPPMVTPAAATNAETGPALGHHSFVRREPLLNRKQRVAAYEFSLKPRLASHMEESPAMRRTLYDTLFRELAAAAGEGGVLGQRLALVPVAPDALTLPSLQSVPRQNLVLMLDLPSEGGELPTREYLGSLRQSGFRLGMYVPPDRGALASLRPQLDFVAVDVAAFDGERLRNLAYALKTIDTHHVDIIAGNVQTVDEFNLCFQRGFDYFQGPAVSLKEAWAPPKGAASRMRIVQLLNLLRNDAETTELAATLKQDPMLSYRILRYINSVGIGLATHVNSIEHALVVLGQQRFYRWLSLLLFSPQGGGFGEWLLVEHALTRGRLMELLGGSRFPATERDALFLVGAFSLLDRLLQQPLEQVVGQLTLPPAVRAALLERSGPYAPLLAVAEACESLDPGRIEAAAAAAGLDPQASNRAMLSAMSWAHEVGEAGTD